MAKPDLAALRAAALELPGVEDFPELATSRLRLREMQLEDATGYAELLAPGPSAVREARARIERHREAFALGHHVLWGLEPRDDASRFAGYLAIHGPRQPDPALSYAVRPAWRRRGFAREAIEAVREYLRAKASVREVVARTEPSNVASAQLLRTLGFQEIGLVDTAAGQRLEFRSSCSPR